MIDIQQLTELISAFRVETEKSAISECNVKLVLSIVSEGRLCKESISPDTVGSILQAIADLLATATSETEYNIIRFWKETKGCCFFVLPGHRWQSITKIIHFAAHSGKYLYLTRCQ